MIRELFEEACEQKDVRGLLSEMRQELREYPGEMAECTATDMLQQMIRWMEHEDAKTRKNAALLLGDVQEAVGDDDTCLVSDALWNAYCREQTLFVRSSYLKSLKLYDCSKYQEEMQKQLQTLCEGNYETTDLKHIRQERKELEEILQQLGDAPMHTFARLDRPYDILLVSNKCVREELQRQITDKSLLVPFGVRVQTQDVDALMDKRLFREMLFYIPLAKGTVLSEECAGRVLAESGLLSFLQNVHEKSDAPFYFRLEIKGRLEEMQRRNLLKKISFEIEEYSHHQLRNSPGNYEVEIRLMQRKDGTYGAFAKLSTIADYRFTYREHVEPTSLSPYVAAEIVELARPYLMEEAQIIDPFCGVGTLLIERNKAVRARVNYGIDIYGTAIKGARVNSELAGLQVNYINRDYFDFTHEYLFDEVIADFPRLYKESREEISEFYQHFFEKTDEITTEEATLILYTNEEGQIKKYLRLNKQFQLVKQMNIQKKDFLFVIKKKG